MATPTTQLTITRTDSTQDVIPIPSGITYADFVLTIVRGQGYWTGYTFVPLSAVKTIVAS